MSIDMILIIHTRDQTDRIVAGRMIFPRRHSSGSWVMKLRPSVRRTMTKGFTRCVYSRYCGGDDFRMLFGEGQSISIRRGIPAEISSGVNRLTVQSV